MINLNPKKVSHRIRLEKLQEREFNEPHFNHELMEKFGTCINKFNETLQSFGQMFFKAQTEKTQKSFVSEAFSQTLPPMQLEQRFSKIQVAIPQLNSEMEENQIKKWLGQLCKTVFSRGFKLYLNETFNQNQAKVFCCENMLFNLIKFIRKNHLKKYHLEFINKSLKNDLIPYFLLKYPQSEALDVNLRLSNKVTEIDNSYSNENDFICSSNVKFNYEPSGQYDSKIMQVLNYLIRVPGQTVKIEEKQGNQVIEEEVNLFNAFSVDFQNLFRKLEDESEVIRMKTSQPNKNKDKKVLTEYENKKKQSYQQKVKQYTKYLIGRKLPQSLSQYSQQQIKAGNFKVKNTSILRIMTKWCHQLQKYFQKINELVVDREEQFRMRDGSEQYLKKTHRILLKKLLQKQKKKIDNFLSKVMSNNYNHQQTFMRQPTIQELECYSEQESMVGMFTSVMFKNNENYIIGYLNKLIHCLMTVEQQFSLLVKSEIKKVKRITQRIQNVCNGKSDINQLIESLKSIKMGSGNYDDKVPELVSFKISDLIRCKCSSKQYQITALYNQIQRISRENPQLFKIVRIKNRLDKGTKDILLNLRYRDKLLMEIQLAVNPEKSKFIQYSDHFNHFLYELERAQFGPISEMCSVWINSDNRATFYRKKFKSLNIRNQRKVVHECSSETQEEKLPFKCEFCDYYWTDENTLEKHQKCLQCNKIICSLCSIQNDSTEMILEKIGIELSSQYNQFQIVEFSKQIPEYGVSINLLSKDIKLRIFRKIVYGEKEYLFQEIKTRQDIDFTLLADITTQRQKSKFIKKNMIVKLEAKRNISTNEIAQKYFVPRYIYDCYEKEKMSILLQKQGIKKAFFSEVDEYKNVRKINFSQNEIRESEWIIQKFPKLQIAVLSENKLEKFHSSIKKLKNLAILNLNSNKLKEIPSQISQLQCLQYLNINNNDLPKLPENFNELKNLKILYASNNKLEKLPELPSTLTLLDINHNKLSQVNLLNLKSLKVATFVRNKIQNIDLSNQQKLQSFDISYNNVGGQFSIKNLYNLQHVQLAYNNFTNVIIEYENPSLAKIKTLDASFNKITNLNQKLYENIVNIQSLNLHNNKLLKLSENVKLLVNIKELNISGIYKQSEEEESLLDLKESSQSQPQSTILPYDIDLSLVNLQILEMNRNQITKIPPYISFMKQLKELYISQNKIKVIKEHINVQVLDISNNRLQVFDADSADKLPNIKELNIKGNQIKKIHEADLKRMINLQEIEYKQNIEFEYIEKEEKKIVDLKIQTKEFEEELTEVVVGNNSVKRSKFKKQIQL